MLRRGAAVPRKTVLGDLFWTAVLFGGAWLVQHGPALARRGALTDTVTFWTRFHSRLEAAAKSAASSGSASRKPTVVTRPSSTLCASKRDRAELHDVAGLGRAAELLGEIIGQRHLHMVGGDLQAVDLGQRAERRLAGHEEIAEQPRIGRRPAAAC